jgi:hypothetical protein
MSISGECITALAAGRTGVTSVRVDVERTRKPSHTIEQRVGIDQLLTTDVALGHEQAGVMRFLSGVAEHRVTHNPGSEAPFEGIDGGLQDTGFGGNATKHEVRPAVLTDQIPTNYRGPMSASSSNAEVICA